MTANVSSCQTLGHHVPVLLSITWGRTGEHYKVHFFHLINGIKYNSFEQFDEEFPGNICDFSAGEKLGFKLALYELFPDVPRERIDGYISSYYKFCVVYFRRTVKRVQSSDTLVPRHK